MVLMGNRMKLFKFNRSLRHLINALTASVLPVINHSESSSSSTACCRLRQEMRGIRASAGKSESMQKDTQTARSTSMQAFSSRHTCKKKSSAKCSSFCAILHTFVRCVIEPSQTRDLIQNIAAFLCISFFFVGLSLVWCCSTLS